MKLIRVGVDLAKSVFQVEVARLVETDFRVS